MLSIFANAPGGMSGSRLISYIICACCVHAASLAGPTPIVVATDLAPSPSPQPSSFLNRPTLTNDWFGEGTVLHDAGFDLRLEWSEFWQKLTSGDGNPSWQYGGKWDAQLRVDLSKLGLWKGLSVTVQGNWNYGESVNGIAGSLIPENAALFFPGIKGSDAYDIMALYLQQDFGKVASLLVGKLNLVEFARATPLRGGGGVDTFWNVNLSTPITGDSPPTIFGTQLRINTQPVSFSLTVFDAQDATNVPLFSNLFEEGVNFMGTATLKTKVAGLPGYYGIKGIYSTREGADLSDIIPPPGVPIGTNTTVGSWFVGFSMQQYLIQDQGNPARGWGVFGEITKADGNPNTLEWSTYVGIGGSSLIPDRPDDRFGVAYFRYGASNDLKKELAPIFNLRDESGAEVFYNVAATRWFRITGDVQFIQPASGDFPNSVYVGLSTYIRF